MLLLGNNLILHAKTSGLVLLVTPLPKTLELMSFPAFLVLGLGANPIAVITHSAPFPLLF